MPEIILRRDIETEMRDGTLLSADVYLPGEGTYPAILLRTPYNKNEISLHAGMLHPFDALSQGFAVIIQDCRGRFESEGEWAPFVHEATDGYDTVEWIASQQWSNGRIGITGASYLGITTWQTVISNPPHLDAALPMITAGNPYNGWTYSGGAFELGFNFRWTTVSLAGRRLQFLEESEESLSALHEKFIELFDNLPERLENLPHSDVPLLTNDLAPYYDTWFKHPTYDDYWEQLDVTENIDSISVPILEIGGWYDKFARGHFDVADAIEAEGPESLRENHHVVVGPWEHISLFKHTPTLTGERNFGLESSMPTIVKDLVLPWFSYHLQDEANEIKDLPRIRYFTTGDHEWRESDHWPITSETRTLYLNSQGNANSRSGNGRLLDSIPDEGSSVDSYEYDPLDPVPSVGGNTLMQPAAYPGVKDQSTVEEREDVLVYTTPRLTKEVRIAGRPNLQLFASSSAPDTDFTAKLVDVEPDGYCANLSEGILRMRHRGQGTDSEFMTPGETYQFSIELWPTAHTFHPGHRIRIEISSSNFPRFDRNPNAKVPVHEADESDIRIALNRVFHDADRPSQLILPITNS